MMRAFLLLLFCSALLPACKKKLNPVYGSEKVMAPGLLKTGVLSYSSTKAKVYIDLVLLDELGLLPESEFEVGIDKLVSGSTVITHGDPQLSKMTAAAFGCYDLAILNEYNASERAERAEVATRNLIYSVADCNRYLYGYYPARNEAFEISGILKLADDGFISDPKMHDQLISKISFDSYEMYQKENVVHNWLNSAVDSLLDLNIWDPLKNNNIVCTYSGANEKTNIHLQRIIDKAKAKHVKLHAIKNDVGYKYDSFALACEATGGFSFKQEEYDFFVPKFSSDAGVAGKHFNSLLKGSYSYYRLTFDVDIQNNTFRSGFWYKTNLWISVKGMGNKKFIPIFIRF